jgi:hypothetical protein
MNFSIIPHIGAGDLRFGMSRSDIRKLIPDAPEQFFRGGSEDNDYYSSLGLFVIYDAAESCVALEFTRPARVTLDALDLLALSKKEAVAIFGAESGFEKDSSGYTSYQFGIGAYYEQAKQAETVIAFSKGYYDMPLA